LNPQTAANLRQFREPLLLGLLRAQAPTLPMLARTFLEEGFGTRNIGGWCEPVAVVGGWVSGARGLDIDGRQVGVEARG
jgi:hypothetical protein